MTDQQTTPTSETPSPEVTAADNTATDNTATDIPAPEVASLTAQEVEAAAMATAKARAQARVRARAQAEAHRRATRPWFRKKRITAPSAFILLCVMVMASTGGKDPRDFTFTMSGLRSKAQAVTKVRPATATVGQSVRDGKFAFRVASMPRPSETVTDRLGTIETAEGVYLIVRVDVTNLGPEPQTLTATDQFLLSDTGKRFATSPAILSVKGAETIFTQEINPGQTVNGAPLLFDVPRGTTITGIEFHDSASSPGVKVKLS